MPLRARVEAFLEHVGREIGQDLRLDERGATAIEIDDLLECQLAVDEAEERIELSAALCVAPVERAEAMYATALRLTLGGADTHGATITLSSPELPVLSLRTSLDGPHVVDAELEREITTFIHVAREARRRLVESGGERLLDDRARTIGRGDMA